MEHRWTWREETCDFARTEYYGPVWPICKCIHLCILKRICDKELTDTYPKLSCTTQISGASALASHFIALPTIASKGSNVICQTKILSNNCCSILLALHNWFPHIGIIFRGQSCTYNHCLGRKIKEQIKEEEGRSSWQLARLVKTRICYNCSCSHP